MNQYFTTRQGAIDRLIKIKRDPSGAYASSTTIVGFRKDGLEVSGLESALLSLRVGQLACFIQTSMQEEKVVFVT